MKPFQEQNYYELLEVPPTASAEEIRAAYDRQVELYSPDSVAVYALEDPKQLDHLRSLLLEAMEILTDRDLRSEYDRNLGGERKPLPPPPAGPDDEDGPLPLAALGRAEVPALTSDVDTEREPSDTDETPVPEPEPADADKQPAPLANPAARSQPRRDHAEVMAEESAIANAEQALVQAAARGKEARGRSVDVASDAEFNGELLRQLREAKGLTLQKLAERTRIATRHLENIEADRYAELPAMVYLRGFLMSIARELGVDGLRVTKSYLALASSKRA
jgi:curved DNA-binding protein CbpA